MPHYKDHPLRREMSQIMHERTLPGLSAPVSLRSWLYLVEDDEREAERAWIERLDANGTGASDHGRLLSLEKGGGKAKTGQIWECHGEFSTYFRFIEGRGDELGFNQLDSNDFPWLDGAPGAVFRSVEISVQTETPDPLQLGDFIDLRQSVCCDVFGGAARIWTDFKLHGGEAGTEIEREEGGDQPAQRTRSGRIFIYDQGLRNDELPRLLQTLIEIGHYRKLALLGFPVARDLIGWLKGAEATLVGITESMAARDASQQVLERLMALSAEVEHRINANRFRQGATEAYYRLTLDRLNALREQRVEGFATMADFVERRLLPAVRTCESASRRLDDLSLRISRASDLLRARISISLDTQNQALLQSMNLRAGLQMKMQALVEGLSVFALSYYIFNLLSAILNPLMGGGGHGATGEGIGAALRNAGMIGLIGLCIWLFIRHKKRHIHGPD